MATARKSASQAEQIRVSQIGDFRERMGGKIELPSGLVVKAKNPGGLTAFIANGTIPNSLLAIVQKALKGGNTGDAMEEASKLADDVDSLGEMIELMDVVTAQVIQEPKVRRAPTQADVDRHNLLFPENQVTEPDELRKEDEFLYTDEIELMDKQFLFQWISGGTRDLETFRQKYESNVAAVSAIPGSAGAAESGDGANAG
jgi:hypothetical protein